MCIFERRLAKNSKQYFRSSFIAWKATKRSASEENFIQFAQFVTEKLQLKNAKKTQFEIVSVKNRATPPSLQL